MTALILMGHKAGYLIVFPSSEQHVEILAVLLAAATLIIAAVAMLVAIGAVVGYSALRDAAVAAGRAAGDSAAREVLAPLVNREQVVAMTGGPADTTEALATALSQQSDENTARPNE
jgi:hypothetical protein